MNTYSIGKVVEDMGFAVRLGSYEEVKARSYDDAVDLAIVKLGLKKGDRLSIITLTGRRPRFCFGRYTYTI